MGFRQAVSPKGNTARGFNKGFGTRGVRQVGVPQLEFPKPFPHGEVNQLVSTERGFPSGGTTWGVPECGSHKCGSRRVVSKGAATRRFNKGGPQVRPPSSVPQFEISKAGTANVVIHGGSAEGFHIGGPPSVSRRGNSQRVSANPGSNRASGRRGSSILTPSGIAYCPTGGTLDWSMRCWAGVSQTGRCQKASL